METISRKDLAIAWLAGMIDADGCISFHRNANNRRTVTTSYRVPYIAITTTCGETIKYITDLYEELGVPYYLKHKNNTNPTTNKPIWVITTQGLKRSKRILPLVEPYLVTKKKEARLVLEFIEIRERLARTFQHDPRETAISDELRKIKANRQIVKNPQRLYARLHWEKI